MNIAKALKEKNKKVGVIKELNSKIVQNNSIPKGDEREYDIDVLIKEVIEESRSLAELKTKIHTASQPIRSKIFLLSELKSQVASLKKVPTKNGIDRGGYRAETIELTSQVKAKDLEAIIKNLEKEIDAIQEELEKFNHATEI